MNLLSGLFSLPLWGLVALGVLFTHLTIVGITLYLHRSQAHRAVDFHPAVAHAMRFWVWLTTGMVTKEWVAVHRKHHATTESDADPHSPQVHGLSEILLTGVKYYRRSAWDRSVVEKYGRGTPDDWIERNLYSRYPILGLSILVPLWIVLFGPLGLTLWAAQMIWVPFFAAGVVNGLGHHSGYRNYDTADASTNLVPWGVVIGGEELHNNHHAYPSSARFSLKPWELDIGWLYIQLLSALGLAKVRRVAPIPVHIEGKRGLDFDTVKALVVARMHVLAEYYRGVVVPTVRDELDRCADRTWRPWLRRGARYLRHEPEAFEDRRIRDGLCSLVEHFDAIGTVVAFRRRLKDIWSRSHASQEAVLQAFQDWCREAEETGVRSLQEFAQRLRGYSLKDMPLV